MTLDLSTWRRIRQNDGVSLVAGTSRICMSSRIRPMRSLATIVRERNLVPAGDIHRLTTDAGELAAWFAVRGKRERAIGMVVADDSLVVVDVIADNPAPIIDYVLRHTCLGTAAERVRRFIYAPPRGWLGIRRPFATCWLPPNAPRDPAVLIVCDAVPSDSTCTHMRDLLWPCALDRDTRPHAGFTWRVRRDMVHLFATARSSRFEYMIQLLDGVAHRSVLDAVLASCEPLSSISAPAPTIDLSWMVA